MLSGRVHSPPMFPNLLPPEVSTGPVAPAPRASPLALFSPTERAERRFWEFFTAHIRNTNTRLAYLAAVRRFAQWCERRGLALHQVEPMIVAAYVEELKTRALAPASVKQHLAALRMLFRLARRRPGPALQPRELGARPEARRQDRQDPGALREGDAGTPRRHRRLHGCRPSRPRHPRRAGLERRGLAACCRLLHPGPTVVLPSPREGRALQRRPRPPHSASFRRITLPCAASFAQLFAARCFSSQRSCPSSIENTCFRACPALALFSSFANLWADTFRCPAPAGNMHSAALGSSGRNRTPRSGSRTTRWSWDHRGNWSEYSVDGFPGMTE